MSSIPSIQPTTVSSRRIPTHHSTHRNARVARPAAVAVAATALVVPIAALAGPGASANPSTTSPNTPSTPAAGAAAGTAARPVVVATGLDNPRQLTFSPSGALYVAEAGVGGAAPCATGPEGKVCFGATGAIAQVLPGRTRRVVTGLPSLAGAGGMSATGPADLHVDRQGRYALLIGLGNNPAVRPTFGAAGARFGTILTGRFTGRLGTGGVPRLATDVSAHEARSNPDKAGIDSNPTGLVWTRWGYVVADAGANALVRVKHARTSTLAVFGPRMVLAPPFLGRPPGTKMPMESVPTSIAYGPDGALYVSELTGFPFPAGASTTLARRTGQGADRLRDRPDECHRSRVVGSPPLRRPACDRRADRRPAGCPAHGVTRASRARRLRTPHGRGEPRRALRGRGPRSLRLRHDVRGVR